MHKQNVCPSFLGAYLLRVTTVIVFLSACRGWTVFHLNGNESGLLDMVTILTLKKLLILMTASWSVRQLTF